MKRLSIVGLLCLFTQVAVARVGETNIPAVRHRLELRKSRSELGLSLGVTFPNVYTHNSLIRAQYFYHFLDWLGVGAEGSFGFPVKTALTSGIERELSMEPGQVRVPLVPRTSLQALFLGKVSVVPLSGKIVLLKKYLGYADFYVSAGAGIARVKGHGGLNSKTTYAIGIGGGLRFFPMDFLSINVEIMDYMVRQARPENRKIGPGESATYVFSLGKEGLVPYSERLTQNPALLVGVSLFLPRVPSRGY